MTKRQDMNLKEDLLHSEVAEVTLVYKSNVKPGERLQIKDSGQMANIFRSVWNTENIELQEECKVMYLNKANRVLGIYPLSVGGTSGTIVDIKLVLIAALRLNASQFSCCHSHPSGNLKPSHADQSVTDKLKVAAEYLNINLLDHIILTKDSYCSMAEEGMI
ncbi:MAG TPA: JAB domain-containing protein [Niabella sp.]|nr:JAB domain-containing protein [Niabella sp.]